MPISTGVPPPPRWSKLSPRSQRTRELGLALLGFLWYAVAEALSGRAARGLTDRFDVEEARPLLSALFLVFLLVVGFAVFESLSSTARFGLRRMAALPRRPTSMGEWGLGTAIGWGLAAGAVLPMALGRSLHVRFWTAPQAFSLTALNAATLFVAALGIEMGLRGYPFRRLVGAVGPSWATILMALALGGFVWMSPQGTRIGFLVTALFTVLLSIAWLRTHALWVAWGLHAAWDITLALLFGLPLRGTSFAGVIQTRGVRPMWLTGNGFGPEGALLTVAVLLVGLVVLVRATGDYAWRYTRPEIVAAAYPVDPPAPAAHASMAEAAEPPQTLVQILPATPHSRTAGSGRT